MLDTEAIKSLPLNNLRRINQNIITISETEGDSSLIRDRLSAVKQEVAQARTDIPALLDELERTRAAALNLRFALLQLDPLLFKSEREVLESTKWLEDLG